MRNTLTRILITGVVALGTLAPALAPAQSRGSWNWEIENRRKHKNEWRNIAIASGLLGVIGLLKDDGTLTFVGTAGALYSAWRYEQDRKSENRLRRARAAYFSKPYFYRNGTKYVRRTVWKNGKKHYQFCKAGKRDD